MVCSDVDDFDLDYSIRRGIDIVKSIDPVVKDGSTHIVLEWLSM
jgi:hypothetical protein